MKWLIPAKTFLLGEYSAITGNSAIVLTTTPCFEISLQTAHTNIHPHSPAGLWWARNSKGLGLKWVDPYHGQGGLGASSAQFLGAYLASCAVSEQSPELNALMDAYYACAWQGVGLRPSGYDVLAQAHNQCVYINHQQQLIESYDWNFKDIAFVLLHSGNKLATHSYLQEAELPRNIDTLAEIVEAAKCALKQADSQGMIQAINNYHKALQTEGFTLAENIQRLALLRTEVPILAAKGCGAMGADVLLVIIPKDNLAYQVTHLTTLGWTVLATSQMLFHGTALLDAGM